MKKHLVCATVICLAPSLALADNSLGWGIGNLPWLSQIAPIVLAVMAALRGIAEAFKAIARATGNNVGNTIAGYVSKAADFLGTVIGWFGIGSPSVGSQASSQSANPK